MMIWTHYQVKYKVTGGTGNNNNKIILDIILVGGFFDTLLQAGSHYMRTLNKGYIEVSDPQLGKDSEPSSYIKMIN